MTAQAPQTNPETALGRMRRTRFALGNEDCHAGCGAPPIGISAESASHRPARHQRRQHPADDPRAGGNLRADLLADSQANPNGFHHSPPGQRRASGGDHDCIQCRAGRCDGGRSSRSAALP
jgi:hypothetical protein